MKRKNLHRKRENRRILEKSALCHAAKDQLCFCRVYLAAYRRRHCLCLSLLSFILLILTRKITRTENGNIDRFQKNLHSVPCRKRSIMFLPSLFSRISSSSSSLSLFALFYLAHFVWQIVKGAGVKRDICRQNSLGSRDRPRFFDQVGHQTTKVSIVNKYF